VASAGLYANHLHLTPDRQPRQHLITQLFRGCMPFLMPNQQCQNTENNINKYIHCISKKDTTQSPTIIQHPIPVIFGTNIAE